MTKYAIICYLIGSIPFAYLCTHLFQGEDIRKIGSHNVGTTNVVKQVGWVPGVLTLLGDMFKGWAAVAIGALAPLGKLRSLLPAFAIAGHNWPIWLRFEGGGGLATFAGSCLALGDLRSIIFSLLVWGVCYVLIGDHDRSAVLACVSAPMLTVLLGQSLSTLLFYISSSSVIALRRVQSIVAKHVPGPISEVQA